MTQTTKPTGGKWEVQRNAYNDRLAIISPAKEGRIVMTELNHTQQDEANARAICESVNATFGNRIPANAVADLFHAVGMILNATHNPAWMDDALAFAEKAFAAAGGAETALFMDENRNEK